MQNARHLSCLDMHIDCSCMPGYLVSGGMHVQHALIWLPNPSNSYQNNRQHTPVGACIGLNSPVMFVLLATTRTGGASPVTGFGDHVFFGGIFSLIPSIIFALFISPSPSLGVPHIQVHSSRLLFPLPTMVHAFVFIARRLQPILLWSISIDLVI